MQLLRAFGFLITTMVMYLGIPLLGWGLGDLPGFFSSGPRLAYAMLVLALGLAVGWQALRSPQGIRGGKGREEKRVSRQRVVRIAVILLLYAGLLFVPYADRRDTGTLSAGPVVRWVGVVLFVLGMALVYWSGVALGRLYSGDVTLQESHRLVTVGPYRLIRHPRYAGGILLGVGLSLLFDSWIGLLATALFVAIILFRIKDEEALMSQAFGQQWGAYCARTHRLVPFVW